MQFLKDCDVDGALIVTTPQEVSIIDVRKEINFCKKARDPLPDSFRCACQQCEPSPLGPCQIRKPVVTNGSRMDTAFTM